MIASLYPEPYLPGTCCDKVALENLAGWKNALGLYSLQSGVTLNGKPVYQKDDDADYHLFYCGGKWKGSAGDYTGVCSAGIQNTVRK